MNDETKKTINNDADTICGNSDADMCRDATVRHIVERHKISEAKLLKTNMLLRCEIVERNRVEKELAARNQYVEMLHKIVPSAIFTVDCQRKITSWNDMAETISGYSEEDVIGKRCFVCNTVNCVDYCIMFADTVEKPIMGQVLVLRNKDGSEKTVMKNADVVRNQDGDVVGCIESFIDITEQTKAAQIKQALQEDLMRSEQSAKLGKLAAGMAHEINNPAAVIQNDMQVIERLAGNMQDKPFVQKILEVVKRDKEAIKRISNIVSAVKGAYRPEEWHMIDINQEIDLQLTLLHQMRGKIVIKTDYTLSPHVTAYGSEIGQAILNLLTNAVDAVDGKGTITICTQDTGTHMRISIRDTGCGIDKKILPHIFEAFFTTKGHAHGIGLGLSMSRAIAKRHKGSLSVENNKMGKGVTCVLEIAKEPYSE